MKIAVILFPAKHSANDLTITRPAQPDRPGQALITGATIGPVRPGAPNSRPLISTSGATFGFVANAKLIEPPYTYCYKIKKNGR